MPRPLLLGALALWLPLGAERALATEDFDAKNFVETRCVGCHDDSIYTRPNRRVDSLQRLEAQVRFCDANLGVGLFDDDIAAVVKHLNDRYYKFDQ